MHNLASLHHMYRILVQLRHRVVVYCRVNDLCVQGWRPVKGRMSAKRPGTELIRSVQTGEWPCRMYPLSGPCLAWFWRGFPQIPLSLKAVGHFVRVSRVAWPSLRESQCCVAIAAGHYAAACKTERLLDLADCGLTNTGEPQVNRSVRTSKPRCHTFRLSQLAR